MTLTLTDFSNDEVAAMPVDRLALLVLQDAIRVNTWNWRNWMLGFENERSSRGDRPATRAVAEAWSGRA